MQRISNVAIHTSNYQKLELKRKQIKTAFILHQNKSRNRPNKTNEKRN
jgi:hypothetical protein